MANQNSNPLEPNATSPQGPSDEKTPPAEPPGGPGDITSKTGDVMTTTTTTTQPVTPEQQRTLETQRQTAEETKKREELTGQTPPEPGTEQPREPVEKQDPAETLSTWRST